MKTLTILLFILLPLVSLSQSDDAVLKVGEKIIMHSAALGEAREIWVYLPPNYNDKYFQSSDYPVLYILDGSQNFPSITGMVQALGSGVNGTFVIPEMIVVAIPNTDRTRDLTPTHSTKGYDGKDLDYLQSSGGADNFQKFIKDELIPKIDSSYRTFPYRVLIGHSFGGILAINMLLSMPETFNAYVAIDPSLWWDNQVLVKQARDYFMKKDLGGKSFFLAQANMLNLWDSLNIAFESIKEFDTILETRNQSGLRWAYHYYENDNHGSVAFIAEYDALRFIFEKYYVHFSDYDNLKKIKEQYRQLSEETKVNFIPPERVIQQFGAFARELKKYDLAQEFFQMNIKNYPQSSSAYANMGELWKVKGDKKKALEYYEKSLKIFPENKGSKNNVESLRKELQLTK